MALLEFLAAAAGTLFVSPYLGRSSAKRFVLFGLLGSVFTAAAQTHGLGFPFTNALHLGDGFIAHSGLEVHEGFDDLFIDTVH